MKSRAEAENDAEALKEWNRRSKKLVQENYKAGRKGKEAADHINSGMADYCEETIVSCKEKYYKGEPTLSDNGFDRIERYLELLRPDSPYLEKVGS